MATEGARDPRSADTDQKDWTKMTDPSTLQDELDKRASQLRQVRLAPPKYSANVTIIISIAVFGLLFGGLMAFPIESIGAANMFHNFFGGEDSDDGDRIQFAIIISASSGAIPGIAYTILRDVEKEQRNDRLVALTLEMRHIRSRILAIRQKEAGESLKSRANRRG